MVETDALSAKRHTLERTVREILTSRNDMSGIEISEKDARSRFKDNSFKLELIDDI